MNCCLYQMTLVILTLRSQGDRFLGVFHLKGIKIKLLNSSFPWISTDYLTPHHEGYSRTCVMAGHQAKSKHLCLCFTASSQSCLSSLLSPSRFNCTAPSALALSIKSCHHTSLSKQKSKLLSADMHTAAAHLAKVTFPIGPW